MAKNVLQEMNSILFDSLQKLSDEGLTNDEMKAEIVRSNAVANTAKMMIDNVKVSLDIMKYADKKKQTTDSICKLLGANIEED